MEGVTHTATGDGRTQPLPSPGIPFPAPNCTSCLGCCTEMQADTWADTFTDTIAASQ